MGKLGSWMLAAAVCVGCSGGQSKTVTQVTPDAGNGSGGGGVDAGPVDAGGGSVDAGPVDAGGGGSTDAGSDAGTPADGGSADAGPKFGGPGPWPMTNEIYGAAQGIMESPVVGVSTDETQNLWVATHSALYVMRPGDSKFTRFDAYSGRAIDWETGIEHKLHLPQNPAAYCFDQTGANLPHTAAGAFDPSGLGCPNGMADPQGAGISEIVGGGSNEVFVGYYGHHDWSRADDGTWTDPWMHNGKLDRVRLNTDGTLDVVRMDMVSNNSVEFWHNKTVWRMVYDHFKHPHELYVGTDHGVDKISPDKWKMPDGWNFSGANHNVGSWFLSPQNQQVWMSDHLHPRACYHAVCVDDGNQRLGDFRGLAIDSGGDLWVGGRWAAGAIVYLADNTNWYNNPRSQTPGDLAFKFAFGDPYSSYCQPGYGRPVFCTPQEGDFVNLSAVAVTKDLQTGQDKIWFSSGVIYNDPTDVNYGVAAFLARPGVGEQMWTYFDPIRDIGMSEMNVQDMLALPDGRLVLAGPTTGLTVWDPNAPKGTRGYQIRAGQGIPSDNVLRIQLDTMVAPPALHVATDNGAAVLRNLK